MKIISCLKITLLASLLCLAFSRSLLADITVFAAASLRGPLEEIAALSPSHIRISYGGSGTLARQIAGGAPADVVLLAHPRWMDWLEGQNLILPESRHPIAGNRLVLVAPQGSPPLEDPQSLPMRLKAGRLAMGQRDSVPAGLYARQWLEAENLWPALQTRLAEVGNVRLALALVARAEVPFGIVYQSDAQADPRVEVLYSIPETGHDPIVYPAGAIQDKGIEFIELLKTVEAMKILESHGFSLPEAP